MIYAAGLAAILMAGIIHTVIATRELLGCGKELSAWKALRIGLRILPMVMMTSLIGTGNAAVYLAPAAVIRMEVPKGGVFSGLTDPLADKKRNLFVSFLVSLKLYSL